MLDISIEQILFFLIISTPQKLIQNKKKHDKVKNIVVLADIILFLAVLTEAIFFLAHHKWNDWVNEMCSLSQDPTHARSREKLIYRI